MIDAMSRRSLMKGAVVTAGAAALVNGSFPEQTARAQTPLPAGTVHSFAKGGLTFHTYVSPDRAVNVTSHLVEFDDQLLMVDATFILPTAVEVQSLIAATGKPVGMAVISHEHPDHWMAADAYEGVSFATLPAIRDAIGAESAAGGDAGPANVMNGPDLAIGMTSMSGVPVDFRHYSDTEAPHMVVAVLPEQKVAIVQDLVYNGVFFAPGVDRANWIATLVALRDDPAFETLLVGHGLPTSRGEFDTAIGYIKAMDEAMATADSPEAAGAMLKRAYPGHTGDLLLSLMIEHWAG